MLAPLVKLADRLVGLYQTHPVQPVAQMLPVERVGDGLGQPGEVAEQREAPVSIGRMPGVSGLAVACSDTLPERQVRVEDFGFCFIN
ncbi:MAG: hypothetical protein R3C45_09720 [Phycisphaerales bacterium]